MQAEEELKAMRLFDDFERTDCGPSRHPESMFEFFNRSGWIRTNRIRQALEGWFAHYPLEHRKDICARFRSKDTYAFHTAIFELVLHELIRIQGAVTVHPEMDWETSSRVDFRVEPHGSEPFILEAVTYFGESEAQQKAGVVVEALCDAVNQIECPDFFLHLRVDGTATQQPSSKDLKQFLRDKLRSLNLNEPSHKEDAQRTAGIEEWVYSANGLTLTFTPTPKQRELRGKPGVHTLGVRSGSFKWGGPVEQLREQLRRKARKYGTPPLPLVIAINVLDWSYQGHHELAQALFGTIREVVQLSWHTEAKEAPLVAESRFVQDRDGLLFDGHTPHYQEVSGVLVFDGVAASSLGVVTARLYLNPWANHPLTTAFSGFPRTSVRDGVLVHEGGKSLAEMLGLPAGWPGIERES